jgi:hypothetical protein
MKAQYKNNDTVTRTMNNKCHRTTKNAEYTTKDTECTTRTQNTQQEHRIHNKKHRIYLHDTYCCHLSMFFINTTS